ncbi:MAG: hypothetical protein WDO74_23585 [Pseudomonadota bacterium]
MAWWFKGIASLTAFAGCLSLFGTARAQAPAPPDWLATKVNESGQHCAALAEHRQADKLLLACAAAGVWEFALGASAPRFVRSYAFAGDVIGFIKEPDGRLWVKLQVLEARPFSSGGAQAAAVFPDVAPTVPPVGPLPLPDAPTAAPALAPPVPARPQLGRVVHAAPGEVVISLGTLNGILRGDHIEFALERTGDSGSEDAELSREVAAIGVVTNVNAQSARVRLGLNESLPAGALASPTRAETSGSLAAPPRVSGLWELELFARPFAALEELGGGVLLSGSVGYRFSHLHLQAVLDPLGFAAVQTKQSVTAVNAALIASYDSQFFEMGLGFGAQTVNETGFLLEPGSGLSAVQLIRLGARDGLNLSARTSIVLFHSQFQFGGMVASGQIPVTRGYWLLLNGGGGDVGYGYGEMGLRVLLAGNGFAGSKYLTVTAGGVGVFRSGSCDAFFSACTESVSYGGPMAGVGGEWRF